MTAEIIPINDFDDFIKKISEMNARANKNVEDWQKEFSVGDCFVRFHDDLVIYGKVLSSDDPEMRHVRFTNCYSELCPSGEVGNTHISSISLKITKAQFNIAKESNWPCDLKIVHSLLNISKGGDA